MPFTGKVGDTFWHSDSSGREHRWIILTNANKDGKVVVVNFTKVESADRVPVIFSKEKYKNQFTHDTTINLNYSELIDKQKVLIALKKGYYHEGKSCGLDIVNEVIIAMFKSGDDTITKVGRELRENYEEKYKQFYTGSGYY